MLKRLLLKPFGVHGFPEAVARVIGPDATILMLHRFAVPEAGVSGHDPALVRAVLAYLRRQRYNLLPLQEVFRRLREGEPLKRTVVFTLDDGYFDQARIAAPLFAEFDCPATIFLTTGFLDGTLWLWWDQIEYIFANTARKSLRISPGGQEVRYRWDDWSDCFGAARDFAVRCQDLPQSDRLACIDQLILEAGVDLPAIPPPAFAPLSWDDARRLESSGFSFGPHSVTHPVLSRMSDDQACWEIRESWQRLSSEVKYPVPVFCYPAGRLQDLGVRETDCVRRLGLWGGVTAYEGKLRAGKYRHPPAIFRVPRAGLGSGFERVMRCISGFDLWLDAIRKR